MVKYVNQDTRYNPAFTDSNSYIFLNEFPIPTYELYCSDLNNSSSNSSKIKLISASALEFKIA